MKVWEAINTLEQMDRTAEVTLVFGEHIKKKKLKSGAPAQLEKTPLPVYSPPNPTWVIDHEYWPKVPYEITCKSDYPAFYH